MAITQIGTAVAPAPPAAPAQDEWWKSGTGLISKSTATPATAASGYAPAQWNVTGNQTVADQVKGIIAQDSPLSQLSKANAEQDMNRRGLINTSMAVGAGQKALYESALPIAQADANMYGQAASANTNATNRAREFDVSNQQQVNLTNAAAANQSSQFNASAENTQQAQINAAKQQTATNNFDAASKIALTDLDNQLKASMVNADAQTKAFLTQTEGDIKQKLINVEADYKTLIQTSATAGDIYKGTVAAIAPIIADTNMNAAAKSAAINGLFSRMGAAMNVVGSINGVDLTDLLQFGTVGP